MKLIPWRTICGVTLTVVCVEMMTKIFMIIYRWAIVPHVWYVKVHSYAYSASVDFYWTNIIRVFVFIGLMSVINVVLVQLWYYATRFLLNSYEKRHQSIL